MRVWSYILSGRLSRKSSSSLENMVAEDSQSLYNDNNCLGTFRDHINPIRTSVPSCIVFSSNTSHFNFKIGSIQLLPTFHGLDLENSYLYLRDFK